MSGLRARGDEEAGQWAMPNNTAPGYTYPLAGGPNAQPEVQEAVERFRQLPLDERAEKPLLYWLLGSGTPPFKMSRIDSAYQDKPFGFQKCGSCRFAWQRVKTGQYICSQIAQEIAPEAWCRLWKP